jgi:tetratricopeptide (TPR) repeat protein
MMVDLLLLGLTIGLMILFDVVFYSPDPNVQTNNKDATNPPFNKALAFKNAGIPDSALIACNKAISIDSTDATGYYLRAQINTQLNKNNEAIKDYTRTLKLSPNHFQAYLNRGMLCMQQKNRLSAFIDFVNAIKISPVKSVSFLLSCLFNSIF